MLGSSSLSVDVMTSMVAIVTVITVLVVGLATLARPSRATITWGAAFTVGMLATYLWIGGNHGDHAALRAGASGLLICFEPLVWLGLRMHRGRPAAWWPVIAFMAAAPVLLAATAGQPVFQLTFRLVFLGGGVFAGLIVYELLRMRSVPRDVTMPLLLASCGFVAISVAGAVSALFGTTASTAEQLSLLRGVNAVGTIVTSTCAAFTIVLLVRAGGSPHLSGAGADEQARRRLQRARAQQDLSWSLLDVRLDDLDDLRVAFAGSAFADIADRFHADVEAVLPPAADVHRIDDGHAVVLLSGSEEAVRHHVRALANRVSRIDDSSAQEIRISASIGWASADIVGIDYDDLLAAAEEAAVAARSAGGDRWKRADRLDGAPS